MTKKIILLISDTHSFVDSRLLPHVKTADEIWHAGDIGEIEVIDQLKKYCSSVRAVFGNIDNNIIRSEFKKDLYFEIEGFKVWITHIGGYPPNYTPAIRNKLREEKPDIFICGHSHILKIIHDKDLDCLHLNPGAAGKSGFHLVQTALKFELENKTIKKMEIIEFKRTP